MRHETTTLKNGLKIVTTPLADAESVAVLVLIGVGSRYEDYQKNGGVSHFLEHLLFKGSKKWPSAQQISEAVDGVGGYNNAYTANDLTCFFVKLPRQHAALALDILCDMVMNPLFDPDEVERERGVIMQEMSMVRDDPARYVQDILLEQLWPHDPLGREILGPDEVIKTIPVDTIAKFQTKFYQPDNMVISVAGRVKPDWVEAEVTKLMGDFKGSTKLSHRPLDDRMTDQLVNQIAREANQTHLTVGCQSYGYRHPNDPAARLLTSLLGSGPSSRLYLNVREKQGLAYHIYSDYHNFTDTGLFEVYAGVDPERVEEVLDAIMAEFKLLIQGPVGEAELTKAKNKINGGLQMALENTATVADRAGTQLLLLNQIEPLEQTVDEINQVTAADIQRVAIEMLKPDRLRLALIASDPNPGAAKFEKLIKESKHALR